MRGLYGQREPMNRVRAPGIDNVVHWAHRYSVFTACTQRNDVPSLEVVEEPPSCLACLSRVE